MRSLHSELLLALQERETLSPQLADLIAQVLLLMNVDGRPTWQQFSRACRLIELVLVAAGEDSSRPTH